MHKAAHWRWFQQLTRLLFIVAGASVPSIVQADSVDPPDAKTQQTCQGQFLLDRRDQPQLALQKLRQCEAVYEAGANLEEFTLWYITLPPKSAQQPNSWFANVWRNKLRVLTSPPISLSKQDAISVLDAGVVRALKTGKREELSSNWRASHDPAIFTPYGSAEAQRESLQVRQAREVAAPPSRQGELTAKVPASHPASRPHRAYPSRPAYHYKAPDYDLGTDELNRNQAATNTSLSGRTFYAAPAYYPSGVQPQPYAASSSYQEPSSYQQARPTPAPQPTTNVDIQHQAFTGPGFEPAPLPLPLQIEANVRAMLQQVTVNIQSFEQAVSRQLRGH